MTFDPAGIAKSASAVVGHMPSGRNAASTLVARFVKQGSWSPSLSDWSM